MPEQCLVIGGSAGSLKNIIELLQNISCEHYATIIVIHLPPQTELSFVETLIHSTGKKIEEAIDLSVIKSGGIYIAPGGYHLYIEHDKSFALSMDEKINFCRPSIDVLFSSTAEVFQHNCIAVLFSGANQDGAMGIQKIHQLGGRTIVQSPEDAEVSKMPECAIATGHADFVDKTQNIAITINKLMHEMSA